MRMFGTAKIYAKDAMFFIDNLSPFSQAGRRGFDPRLPLQFFNSLADSTFSHFTSKTRSGLATRCRCHSPSEWRRQNPAPM